MVGTKKPTFGTEIFVSGRQYKVDGDLVSYEQIVKIWNELHESEGKHIIGTPGIDYEHGAKEDEGVLLPAVLSHRLSWDCEFQLMVLGRRRGVFEL